MTAMRLHGKEESGAQKPNPSHLLQEKVKKGELGFKSGKGFYDKWTHEDIKRVRGNVLQ
jgi:3-hydroxyacyl-CoA dehydrogenase